MKLVSSGPLLLTRLEPYEALHPEKKHLGVTSVVQDLATREGRIRVYDTPLPKDRSYGYQDIGRIWEIALEVEFARRQGERSKKETPELITQDKMCVENSIHMIPDGYIPKKLGHEYKATFKRPPAAPEDLLTQHWAWGMQTQAYAHVLGIYNWEFYVLWLDKWPIPIMYKFKYDKKECAAVWGQIKEHAELMRKRTSTEIV